LITEFINFFGQLEEEFVVKKYQLSLPCWETMAGRTYETGTAVTGNGLS